MAGRSISPHPALRERENAWPFLQNRTSVGPSTGLWNGSLPEGEDQGEGEGDVLWPKELRLPWSRTTWPWGLGVWFTPVYSGLLRLGPVGSWGDWGNIQGPGDQGLRPGGEGGCWVEGLRPVGIRANGRGPSAGCRLGLSDLGHSFYGLLNETCCVGSGHFRTTTFSLPPAVTRCFPKNALCGLRASVVQMP